MTVGAEETTPAPDDDGRFQEARTPYDQSLWDEAIESFDRFIEAHPHSAFRVEAEFLKIRSLFLAERLKEYQSEARRFVEEHPDHPKLEMVLFYDALVDYVRNERGEQIAIDRFKRFLERFPDPSSPWTVWAKHKLGGKLIRCDNRSQDEREKKKEEGKRLFAQFRKEARALLASPDADIEPYLRIELEVELFASLWEEGQWEQMELEAKEYVDANPNDAERRAHGLFYLGFALARKKAQGEYGAASEAFAAMFDVEYPFPRVSYRLHEFLISGTYWGAFSASMAGKTPLTRFFVQKARGIPPHRRVRLSADAMYGFLLPPRNSATIEEERVVDRFGGANAIVATKDEGFAIAGTVTSSGTGTAEAFLLKTDTAGKALWSRKYGDESLIAGAIALEPSAGGIRCRWHGRFNHRRSASRASEDGLLRQARLDETFWRRADRKRVRRRRDSRRWIHARRQDDVIRRRYGRYFCRAY